jgi:hypothetical protein
MALILRKSAGNWRGVCGYVIISLLTAAALFSGLFDW